MIGEGNTEGNAMVQAGNRRADRPDEDDRAVVARSISGTLNARRLRQPRRSGHGVPVSGAKAGRRGGDLATPRIVTGCSC